jgi:hypothetical protein
MKRLRSAILAAALVAVIPYSASAQTATQGSAACGALYQSAANGAAARVSADDTDIAQPQSVKNLTCLNKFFSGIGLNVIINLLNPQTLLNAIENQICTALTNVWTSTLGNKQCGITLTGFKIGTLGGSTLGGGLSCPKLTFGGGGPAIASIGIGANNTGKLSVTGNAVAPTGYPLTSLLGLY